MATAPMHHEMTAAGPATITAFLAPKSQPEPMIDPTEAQSSPISPTSRRSLLLRTGVPVGGVADGASCSTDAMGEMPSRGWQGLRVAQR